MCPDYPTYFDAESGECVETCPLSYYGVVSGRNGSIRRTCEPSK